MKRIGKPVFFIVFIVIASIAYTTFFGISSMYGDKKNVYIKSSEDIRLGIDIKGGVDVTFSPPAGTKATKEQMSAAESVIKLRLLTRNITDSEVYTDYNKYRIIVRFPWKAGESNFDPEAAIKELGETALLTFREGKEQDQSGAPTGKIVLVGKDIKSASNVVQTDQNTGSTENVVKLELNASGKDKFSEVTGRLKGTGEVISIWMDNTLISYPKVDEQISDGTAIISGSFTPESAKELADKINSGGLPFKLQTQNYNTISPTLGMNALDAMVLAGIIAFICVALFMISWYRVPGLIASFALVGQASLAVAAISGYFAVFPSFTLTLPGIAGIILSIGMGVDANIITSERIKEELRNGRTIDGAIENGAKEAFSAIFDGNITVIIVSIILMGAFGPPDSPFAKLLSPIFNLFGFGATTAGAVYSFGYTLFIGVLVNFLMGVTASGLMLKSVSKFKFLRKPWLYGGKKV